MKTIKICLICGATMDTSEATCASCGEASFGEDPSADAGPVTKPLRQKPKAETRIVTPEDTIPASKRKDPHGDE